MVYFHYELIILIYKYQIFWIRKEEYSKTFD